MRRMLLLCLLAVNAAWGVAREKEEPDGPGFDTRNFTVAIETMEPRSYSLRVLGSGYEVSVRNDSVFCHLPYVGRVYQPSFDNDGLTFERPLKDFRVKQQKKGRTQITFIARKNSVVYTFNIIAYPGGDIRLSLFPSNAQSISYSGRIDAE